MPFRPKYSHVLYEVQVLMLLFVCLCAICLMRPCYPFVFNLSGSFAFAVFLTYAQWPTLSACLIPALLRSTCPGHSSLSALLSVLFIPEKIEIQRVLKMYPVLEVPARTVSKNKKRKEKEEKVKSRASRLEKKRNYLYR